MSRSRSAQTLAALTALLTLGLGLAPSSQAAEEGASLFRTYGPNGNAHCDGSGIISGHLTDFGTAVINETNGKVSATVVITGGRPNTRYVIRLIQTTSDGEDCYTVDKVVRTKEQGIATVHFSEPVLSDANGAFLAVETGSLFGTPGYVTRTYYY